MTDPAKPAVEQTSAAVVTDKLLETGPPIPRDRSLCIYGNGSYPSTPWRRAMASSFRLPMLTSGTTSTRFLTKRRSRVIDSVGSQANRLEPIFKAKFKALGGTEEWLVPQMKLC